MVHVINRASSQLLLPTNSVGQLNVLVYLLMQASVLRYLPLQQSIDLLCYFHRAAVKHYGSTLKLPQKLIIDKWLTCAITTDHNVKPKVQLC